MNYELGIMNEGAPDGAPYIFSIAGLCPCNLQAFVKA
jgi:hypothetical protein